MASSYGTYPIVSSSIDGDDAEYAVNDLKLLFRLFNGVDIDRPVKIGTKWAFDVSIRQKPIVTPIPDIDYGQSFCDISDSNKPKYMKPDGTVIDLSTGAPDASTSVKGIVELATDLESAANLAVQANDTRLSNSRTPLSHSHLIGDLPGTLIVTTDPRLSDSRTPTAHNHVKADVTDFAHTHLKVDVTDFAHTHLIADLPGALVVTSDSRLSDARTPTSHSHVLGDLPGTLLTTSNLKNGVSTQSGNGVIKVFNIAHGFGSSPTSAIVVPGSNDAIGPFVTSKDSTNVVITFPTAPPAGTNNLIFNWLVV